MSVYPAVRKAVIPAAGYGTRFLPVAKAVPKEMLPVIDKPVIQYVVEEAVASGITDILFVISRSKRAIEEHFISNHELELDLECKAKTEALASIKHLAHLARFHFVYQNKMGGLGDAIRCAQSYVGNEAFAVLLGDALLKESAGQPAVLKQLLDVHAEQGGSVVALEEVPLEKVNRYGILAGAEVRTNVYRAEQFVEKPSIETAPSRLAVSARYVLSPQIFDALERTPLEKGGELQLTDAMALLMTEDVLHGVRISGKRHDVGNKLDFLKANIELGLERKDISADLETYLRKVVADLDS